MMIACVVGSEGIAELDREQLRRALRTVGGQALASTVLSTGVGEYRNESGTTAIRWESRSGGKFLLEGKMDPQFTAAYFG